MQDGNGEQTRQIGRCIKQTASYLCETIGPRPPGSYSELKASEYLLERFSKTGLETWCETFASDSHFATDAHLMLDSGEGERLRCLPLQFSPAAEARGELVFLGNDRLEVDEEENYAEKIGLLVPDADLFSRHRVMHSLEKSGLEGLIIISPKFDTIVTKIARTPELEHMPVVSVPYSAGLELRKKAGTHVYMKVNGNKGRARGKSQNVLARKQGHSDNWFIISAHYDTAPYSPGATDNAGGVAALLEMAKLLAAEDLKATVYLVATGSEEHGGNDGTGRGAQDLLARREGDLEHCLGYLEIDSLGNCLGQPVYYANGDRRFRKLVEKRAKSQNYQFRGKASIGCDHGAAEQRGLPYIWFTSRCPRPHYHTPRDSMEHLDVEQLACGARDIAAVAETLSELDPVFPYLHRGRILIRPGRHADIPAIRKINRRAFGPASTSRMQQDFFGEKLGGREWHEHKNREVEEFCRDYIYRVVTAEYKERVVGYATYILDSKKGMGVIGNNAVDPDCQGRGIGTALQEEISRRMLDAGYTRSAVTTLASDIPAQRVYEKLGYEKYTESYHYLKEE